MTKFNDLMRGPTIDSFDIDRIKHMLNSDVVNKLMIKYFIDKGFESFDRPLYPAVIQDLSIAVPALSNKVEVIPHAKDIDLSMDKAVLSWNMFVLGNQRMYLGDTYHTGLQDLARQIRGGSIKIPDDNHGIARRQTTPRRVVSFMSRVLSSHDNGYVDLNTNQQQTTNEPYSARSSMLGMPQQNYSRVGYGT